MGQRLAFLAKGSKRIQFAGHKLNMSAVVRGWPTAYVDYSSIMESVNFCCKSSLLSFNLFIHSFVLFPFSLKPPSFVFFFLFSFSFFRSGGC